MNAYYLQLRSKVPNICEQLNSKKEVLGTITDGDIRRALINGVDFSQSIKRIYNKKPFYIKEEKRNKLLKNIPKKIFRNYKIIPVINRNKTHFLNRILLRNKNNLIFEL